jgi:hypothetical protein
MRFAIGTIYAVYLEDRQTTSLDTFVNRWMLSCGRGNEIFAERHDLAKPGISVIHEGSRFEGVLARCN